MKTYYISPPECSDGVSNFITDSRDEVISCIRTWMEENLDSNDESITIKICQMTDEQFKALPEI